MNGHRRRIDSLADGISLVTDRGTDDSTAADGAASDGARDGTDRAYWAGLLDADDRHLDRASEPGLPRLSVGVLQAPRHAAPLTYRWVDPFADGAEDPAVSHDEPTRVPWAPKTAPPTSVGPGRATPAVSSPAVTRAADDEAGATGRRQPASPGAAPDSAAVRDGPVPSTSQVAFDRAESDRPAASPLHAAGGGPGILRHAPAVPSTDAPEPSLPHGLASPLAPDESAARDDGHALDGRERAGHATRLVATGRRPEVDSDAASTTAAAGPVAAAPTVARSPRTNAAATAPQLQGRHRASTAVLSARTDAAPRVGPVDRREGSSPPSAPGGARPASDSRPLQLRHAREPHTDDSNRRFSTILHGPIERDDGVADSGQRPALEADRSASATAGPGGPQERHQRRWPRRPPTVTPTDSLAPASGSASGSASESVSESVSESASEDGTAARDAPPTADSVRIGLPSTPWRPSTTPLRAPGASATVPERSSDSTTGAPSRESRTWAPSREADRSPALLSRPGGSAALPLPAEHAGTEPVAGSLQRLQHVSTRLGGEAVGSAPSVDDDPQLPADASRVPRDAAPAGSPVAPAIERGGPATDSATSPTDPHAPTRSLDDRSSTLGPPSALASHVSRSTAVDPATDVFDRSGAAGSIVDPRRDRWSGPPAIRAGDGEADARPAVPAARAASPSPPLTDRRAPTVDGSPSPPQTDRRAPTVDGSPPIDGGGARRSTAPPDRSATADVASPPTGPSRIAGRSFGSPAARQDRTVGRIERLEALATAPHTVHSTQPRSDRSGPAGPSLRPVATSATGSESAAVRQSHASISRVSRAPHERPSTPTVGPGTEQVTDRSGLDVEAGDDRSGTADVGASPALQADQRSSSRPRSPASVQGSGPGEPARRRAASQPQRLAAVAREPAPQSTSDAAEGEASITRPTTAHRTRVPPSRIAASVPPLASLQSGNRASSRDGRTAADPHSPVGSWSPPTKLRSRTEGTAGHGGQRSDAAQHRSRYEGHRTPGPVPTVLELGGETADGAAGPASLAPAQVSDARPSPLRTVATPRRAAGAERGDAARPAVDVDRRQSEPDSVSPTPVPALPALTVGRLPSTPQPGQATAPSPASPSAAPGPQLVSRQPPARDWGSTRIERGGGSPLDVEHRSAPAQRRGPDDSSAGPFRSIRAGGAAHSVGPAAAGLAHRSTPHDAASEEPAASRDDSSKSAASPPTIGVGRPALGATPAAADGRAHTSGAPPGSVEPGPETRPSPRTGTGASPLTVHRLPTGAVPGTAGDGASVGSPTPSRHAEAGADGALPGDGASPIAITPSTGGDAANAPTVVASTGIDASADSSRESTVLAPTSAAQEAALDGATAGTHRQRSATTTVLGRSGRVSPIAVEEAAGPSSTDASSQRPIGAPSVLEQRERGTALSHRQDGPQPGSDREGALAGAESLDAGASPLGRDLGLGEPEASASGPDVDVDRPDTTRDGREAAGARPSPPRSGRAAPEDASPLPTDAPSTAASRSRPSGTPDRLSGPATPDRDAPGRSQSRSSESRGGSARGDYPGAEHEPRPESEPRAPPDVVSPADRGDRDRPERVAPDLERVLSSRAATDRVVRRLYRELQRKMQVEDRRKGL